MTFATHHSEPIGFQIWPPGRGRMMERPHTHSDIEINFLFEGGPSLRYLHGGAIYEVVPDRFAILWGGIPHQILSPEILGEGIWITLPLAWFLQWEIPNHLGDRLLAGEIIQGAAQAGERTLLERWVDDFQSGEKMRRRVLLLEIEARLHRLALAQPKRRARAKSVPDRAAGTGQIERITHYLAEHYREPLSVRDIASAVGLNEKYLMRMFKRLCRISVWEYLARLRVSHAQRLLITTDWKVVDVALESGFASVAPFYAAFKAHSQGLRPLAYRQQHSFAEKSGL